MRKVLIIFVICHLSFVINLPALAANFNPDYLISDKELTHHKAMTLEEIDLFLKKFNGALANYYTQDIDGRVRSASEIIFKAAQRYKINPQVLITLLQKEQTLLTKKASKPTQYDWAMGFACYDGRAPIELFRGFARQVDRAAWRLRYFLEHPWQFVFRPGQIYKISGLFVIPQNLATAALYNYTPHVFGNQLFWRIWRQWFGQELGPIENNTLVKLKNEPGIWLIQNGKRRPFYSKNVFLANFSLKNVRIIPEKELLKYEIGEPMDFPNYSLLENEKGERYLKVDNEVRFVPDNIFREIGFNPEEVIKISDRELKRYKLGKPVLSPYPTGVLLQDSSSGAVYFVKDEFKYPIFTKEILLANFPYDRIIKVKPERLAEFILGEPVKFRDGSLLKTATSDIVYLISEGKRRPIASPAVFAEFGYQWESVITVREEILNLHPLGEPVEMVDGIQ
ncbi:MAG: hypothetical protein N2259_00345 [Patescibacteria group bacterium]|nr:hypothetical protein [Patescibacteria group bacterium]